MEQSGAVKTFEELFAELGERARVRPAGSATVAALDGGVHGLGKKILEEAGIDEAFASWTTSFWSNVRIMIPSRNRLIMWPMS